MRGIRTIGCATALLMLAPAAWAGRNSKGNGSPKGKFEKFNIVAPGNPNTTQDDLTNFLKNDNSNGRAIFIPIKTRNAPDSILCANADGNGGSWIVGDSANTNLYSAEPSNGVKIYFYKSDTAKGLEIVDRDATDGYAEINVPSSWANASSIDLYVRALGKPGGCFQTDAYSFDGNDYFYAGTAVLKRKAGQSTFVDAGELTNVYYCPDGYYVFPTGGHNYECTLNADGTGGSVPAVEINVFAAVFDSYLWDVTNAGTRLVQVLMRANF